MLRVLNSINPPLESKQLKDIIVKAAPSYGRNKTGESAFMSYVKDHIVKYKDDELVEILKRLNVLFPLIFDKVITRNLYMSQVRKQLSEKYGQDSEEYRQSLDKLKITKEQKAKLVEKYIEDVKERNQNRKEFKTQDLLQTAFSMLAKTHWADKALGLLMISGGRPIDLLVRNTYEPATEKGYNYVKVSNLAKKRGEKKQQTTERPIINMKASEFIENVKNLRDGLKERDLVDKDDQLMKSVANILSDHLHKYGLFQDESPRVLRQIYGNLSYELYADKKKQNLNLWLSKVLGHDPADIQTSFSYSVINVDSASDEGTNREVLQKMDEYKAEHNTMKDAIKELRDEVQHIEPPTARVQRRQGRTDAEVKEILKIKIAEMKRLGIKITNTNLRDYAGMGYRAVNKYYKELVKE